MKILVVSPYIYPQGSGVGRIVFSLTNKLVDLGHDITVLCSGNRTEEKIKEKIIVIKKKPLFYFRTTPIRFRLFFDLISVLRKNQFDLIIAFTPVPYFVDIAAMVSKIFSLPFYVSYHTFSMKREEKFINSVTYVYQNIFERITLKRARRVFFHNFKLAEANLLPRFNKKLSFVNIGIDKIIFKPKPNNQNNYILYVGPLNKGQYWKGIDYLLKAMKIVSSQNSEIKLKIAGSGNRKNYYQKLSNKLNLQDKVDFLGFMSNDQLVSLYQNCKFLVLPSYDGGELVPTVITEAFSCSKTVISTKTAGIPYLVEDGIDGMLVEPKNEQALAKAILTLWQNDALRIKLEKSAFQKTLAFSWTAMAKDIVNIIEYDLQKYK